LPVLLEPKAPDTFLERVKVRPTRAGETHVATRIAETEQASGERWTKLPPLTTVNPIRRVKPGAAVLLAAGPQDGQVVLAYQRYGAGKAIALPVQDSWLWRMDAAMPVDDGTFQTLWRSCSGGPSRAFPIGSPWRRIASGWSLASRWCSRRCCATSGICR